MRVPEVTHIKMLDLFCGLGGVSNGFAEEGFDVLGIDIEDMKSKGYKHQFVKADVKELDGSDFQGYDVIWGSPPCRDFSEFARVYGKTWKNPPNPEKGLENVFAFLNFVEKAKPRFWIMENVKGITYHLDMKPKVVTNLQVGKNGQGKTHAFYGNFPAFLIPKDNRKRIITRRKKVKGKPEKYPASTNTGKLGKWINAKIPLAVSRSFARACKQQLMEVAVI